MGKGVDKVVWDLFLSEYYCVQRIRGFGDYALYKSTLLTY